MPSGNDAPDRALQHRALERAQRLRRVIGVDSPQGFLVVGGCRFAWRRVSTGIAADIAQAVVCLHDAGSGSREFYPLLDRVPTGSQLFLFDWPGHGRSADPVEGTVFSVDQCCSWLQEILTQPGPSQSGPAQTGSGRPILLGSGFGASVAIHFAAAHPDQVAGLILCQPSGLFAPAARDMAARDKAARICGQARRQALRVEIVGPALRRYRDEALASLRQSEASLRSALESLSCPVLFALSSKNRTHPLQAYLSFLNPLLSSARQHRLTVFDGDCNPIWDEPERFAQALSGFIQAQLPLSRHLHAWLLSAVDWPTRGMNHWKCVHPECPAEQLLPEGQNANQAPSGYKN